MSKHFGAVIVALALSLCCRGAYADWHSGRITQISFGYDGSTITFAISGWSRNNCTCYSTWPNTMCLNRSRVSFKDEYAWLLKARAMDQYINVNIDESTCSVVAMYEND
jgi:hypothetical protein